jgi:SPP1 gp7 family putative phage head morphogenesis protein
MAVTRETLKLLGGIRIRIAEGVDAATDDLVRSWARAWKLVEEDWKVAIAELQQLRDDGKWPTRTQILRAERTQAALEATYQGLLGLSDRAGITIAAAVNDVTEAASGHVDVIASQLPTTATGTTLRGSLVRADAKQIEAIVVRVNEQVSKLITPLAGDAFDAMVTELVRGVAEGANPRASARRMLRNLQGQHSIGLNTAMVIARTETLDAHRSGAREIRTANADVLAGWQWISALDTRTCPSCFGMHGSIHPAGEFGPIDHQQGRCSALPVTKTWAELGFDIPEPPSLVPDAQTVFDKMSDANQLKVMGPTRLELLKSGDVTLADLSQRRSNPGWRDSQTVTPLRDLIPA